MDRGQTDHAPGTNPIEITLDKNRLTERDLSTGKAGKYNPSATESDVSSHVAGGMSAQERRKLTSKQDKRMRVLEECGLCHEDFAVYFCPHCDAFYCESCDKLLHQFDSSSHTRLRV